MKIGIDVSRMVVGERTGTENYTYWMTKKIFEGERHKRHEWVLYVRSLDTKSGEGEFWAQIRKLTNVRVVEIPLKHLWTQVGLAWRTWIDGIDVLWIPAHTLPVLRSPFVKTIVTIHGIEYEWLPAFENRLQSWYLPLSTKYAIWCANQIIAVSGFTRSQIVERMGGNPKKIKVVWEGVIENGTSLRSKFLPLGQKYGISQHKYLLCLGTVQPRKNLVRLVEAFSRLSNRYPDLKLVIAGKLGWSYDEILASPTKYGVAEKVIFCGYINEAERYTLLHNAVLFVQPSITEGFGLPVIEAFAAGIPVVSSFGGALAEIVGNAGVLVDPYDVPDIEKGIEKLIGNRKLRNQFVERGKGRLGLFDWNLAANEVISLIETL